MLAQPTLRFRKTAHCHPKINQLPELVKGRVTRQLPLVWKSSAILETLCWYSTSRVWEWETQNRSYRYYWELLTKETCPLFNWTQSTAGVWTGAQISGVLKSTDVFCPKTCSCLYALRFYVLMPLADLFITLFFYHDLKQCLLISYFIITLLLGELLKSNCWENVWGFGGCWTQPASSCW